MKPKASRSKTILTKLVAVVILALARRRGGQVRKRRIACKHGLVAAAAGHRDRAGTYHKGSLQRAVHRRSGRQPVHLRLCARRDARHHPE